MTFEVTFLGTCGSCSYNSGIRGKYGTNTPCVAVRAGDENLVFDTGTGFAGFAFPEGSSPNAHIFYSHYHSDHVNGLLFQPSFFDPSKRFDFYGQVCDGNDVRTIADKFLSPPWHPVGFNVFGAQFEFHTIEAGDSLKISDKVAVKSIRLSHPGGAVGYRVDHGGKSLCYLSDCELGYHQGDDALTDFLRDADLLVLDTFFDDGKVIPDWGHSSWSEGIDWAKRAGVKRLALFHHNFRWSDAEIDDAVERAQAQFPNTFAAADFMKVEV
jgi:phosphoribosyl 1,2-cyclic phosphodiesterase